MRRCLVLAFFAVSSTALAQGELGLDLSPEAAVKTVVVVPPVYRTTSNEGGSFAGFQSAKVLEKHDTVSHKKLVQALEKALGPGKVVSAEATHAALTKESLRPPALRTPSGMALLAKATGAAWVIYSSFDKGVLSASIYNLVGETTGKAASLPNVQVNSLTVAQADELAKALTAHLVALAHAKQEEVVVAPPPPPPPPAEEEVSGEVESEIARDRARQQSVVATIDRNRPRVVLAVGGGALVRNQSVGGDLSGGLAELKGGTAAGVAVYAQLNPFSFVSSLRDTPLSELFADVNYRRDFVRARAVGGALDGQSCALTDDEVQVRGNFRWAFGGMAPSIGVGAGWAQERAVVSGCDLPLLSAIYRGVDVQLRVRQPLFRDVVALDLAFGPRVLLPGPLAPKTGLSLAGEAWIEAKPVSVLFVRGGGRFFRAVASDDVGVVTVDVRAFFALEVGVHL